ncbi:hypothetical protein COHA_000453 [Chlorella ohadii]|uniref:Xrn1 helical domain-containing protein n=1 Tax=Chlorella ohadii TaxID=2649997 RepID=A0AAD5DYS0_9CHLO|nr:hypothetical protein COHA_000453 [Chlorella ohadii]
MKQELLSSGRGYLTSSGRIDPDKLCWLFARLANEEEATFQARERRKVQEQRRKMHQEAEAAGGSGREGGPAGASWMGDGWVSMGELAPGQSLDEALAGTAWGGNPDVPTAAQFAGDPAALRRELSRRVRERMSDRADAGMAADPVRLAMPGFRGRYYTKCFDAPAPSGPELEQLARRVCASFCRTLCWNLYHYAPLASDLAKYGREALRGTAAAACRPHPPIQPFAQLCSVLPFSSMPTCLPPLLARAAADPADGLAALHGSEAGDVFPQDVSALVDLSGKKWAHTAVVRLPFPDVEAISDFVREQLGSEECRLSEEERRRNQFAPALLLLPEGHPLALHLLQRVDRGNSSGSSGGGGGGAEREAAGAAACEAAQGEGDTGAAAAEDAPDAAAGCASILSLLLPSSAAEGDDSGSQRAGQMAGVLCWPLDLAGQDTPAFAAGLLPGASSSSSISWGGGEALAAPPPAPSRSGRLSRSSSGSRAYWPTADAFVLAGSSWADEVEAEEAEEAAAAAGAAAPAARSVAMASAVAGDTEPPQPAARPHYAPVAAAAAAAVAAAVTPSEAQPDDEAEDWDELMPWLATPARPAEEPAAVLGAAQSAEAAGVVVAAAAEEEEEGADAALSQLEAAEGMVTTLGLPGLVEAGVVPAAKPAQQAGGPAAACQAAAEPPAVGGAEAAACALEAAAAQQTLGPPSQQAGAELRTPAPQEAGLPAKLAAAEAAAGQQPAQAELDTAAATAQAQASAFAELENMLALLGMQ